MNVQRDDFIALPSRLALGLLFDLFEEQLAATPRPQIPRPPKYDGRIARKGGFVWMSEMDLGSLTWWEKTKRESAEAGGEYAERDAKLVTALGKWIEWRTLFPHEVWSGTRGEERKTARPPSREPQLNRWEGRPGNQSSRGPAPEPRHEQEDDDINF